MSRRQRSSRSTADGVHPTYAKILEQAVAELTEHGFDLFNVQRVLDAAEVSRGTLYHHFPDVETLIEAALIESFSQENVLYRSMLADLVERSTDLASFRDGVRELLRLFSTTPAVVRLRRTHTIALSATRPALAAAIAPIQASITDAWADTVREAKRRGYLRPDLDDRAVAVVVQAVAIGRIVDDADDDPIGDDRWAAIHFDLLDRTFIVSDPDA